MEEKKYKDVLKGIIEIIRNAEHSDIGFASICTYISDHCPELESKDEKIREKLIEYFKDLMGGWFPYSNEEIIAYLEKVKDFDKQLEDAYKTADEVQYKRGYGKGYADGMVAAKKKELEKQGEKPTTISVDKMVGEFEDFRVISCGRIPSFAELDAYRKGVTDALSKILIKEEKPITIGSKKAEGKLCEMIAASKEPAKSGEEDKQLTRSQVSKKSEQDGKKWIDEKVYWKEREELFEDGKQEVINNPAKYGLIKDENHIADDSKKVESKMWSEEDKEMKDLIDEISCQNDDVCYETHVRILRWLNELKQRLS